MAAPLGHALWIGGPPGAGKTTIALRVARRHGLRWYGADTQTWAHRDRALAAGHPAARRSEAMAPRKRWEVTAAEMVEMSLHAERGRMVVDDLRRLPEKPLVVAEGSTISPEAVTSGIADPSRALWLIPTRELRRARLEERDLQPAAQELYEELAAAIEREVRQRGVEIVTLDGSEHVDDVVAAVEARFACALASCPHAESVQERRVLLREANAAVAAQVRAYFAREWASGSAESVLRELVCECGDTTCEAGVVVPIGSLTDEPVLAPDHG